VPIQIEGQTYYRTSEACKRAGVSRATLFRWLKAGILDKCHKDRRGWKMFTDEDLERIKTEAQKIKVEYLFPGKSGSSEANDHG
jgi:predicted site-specific integrase-resolvase